MRFVLNPLTGLLDRVNQLNIGEFVQGGTVGSVLFIDANGLVRESNPGLTYDGTDLTIVGDLTVNTLNYTTLNPAIDLSGRATTELDNLGTVAINTSLISDTDSTDDLGSSSVAWANLFVDKILLNANATLDGATDGDIIVKGDFLPSAQLTGTLGSVSPSRYWALLRVKNIALNGASGGAKITSTGSFVQFATNAIPDTDSVRDLGSTSKWWDRIFVDEVYVNSSSINSVMSGLTAGQIIFNREGADIDFIFEGDTDQNLLFLNAGSDVITIGSATELAKFGIDGNSDEIQFLVQGHSTQTSFLAVFEQSDGTDVVTIDNDGSLDLAGRLLGNKGVDVASATDITLGLGNYFDITGTTQIDTIAATGWTAGSVVTLQFDASVTVKHNTAGTGAVMLLAGAVDFAATVGDTLSFVFDGTAFRELARTAI